MRADSTPRRPGPSCSRREFLAATGALATVPLLARLARHPAGDPLGVQLYAVREAYRADPTATLTALAAMGYREVEYYDGLYSGDMGETRALLDRLGLVAPSGHMGLGRLEGNVGRAIHHARQLGHRYIIVPSLDRPDRTRAAYDDLAARLQRLAPHFRRAGITLGYHNHEYDIRPLEDGRSGLEVLLDALPAGEFAMEFDLFWAKAGGGDIAAYFRRYPQHFRLVHIKDMSAEGRQVDVGRGILDWPALLAAARAAGVRHWLAEIDDTPDALAFARTSYQYLASIAW